VQYDDGIVTLRSYIEHDAVAIIIVKPRLVTTLCSPRIYEDEAHVGSSIDIGVGAVEIPEETGTILVGTIAKSAKRIRDKGGIVVARSTAYPLQCRNVSGYVSM